MKPLENNVLRILYISLCLTISTMIMANAANNQTENYKKNIISNIEKYKGNSWAIGNIKVDKLDISDNNKQISINLSENVSWLSFNGQTAPEFCKAVKSALPAKYNNYKFNIKIGNKPIEYYISSTAGKYKTDAKVPFITNNTTYNNPTCGLNNNIIALWQSHGYYFEPKLDRWEWQRARIFETVEDLYTQSYVVPFLIPMLENAGAYVMTPRDRDMSDVEIIIDSDASTNNSVYSEGKGKENWQKGKGKGFAHLREQYIEYQNPFTEGEYRVCKTVTDEKNKSIATWTPNMPKAGEYAVYVSYKTLPNSSEKAKYTVNYAGGKTEFTVNQKMGSGTWIYLGHFKFNKGKDNNINITLSNVSDKSGEIVTADAVKIGGGIGNIARKVSATSDNVKSSDGSKANTQISDMAEFSQYCTSGYPRFTEGARYWLQWAGIPDSVYSPSHLVNDYTDDYRSRGIWVNYLAGGSKVLPKNKGLNIPIDMSFAFHSDAGTTLNDSTIGTLGIYYTDGDKNYANGTPRTISRDLTDFVMTNIVNDIRAKYEPQWSRRGMWNKSYYEARVPEVPTMLLELLSHQNYADMKYGLDPRFRFTVSRAIYKGMLQFLSHRDGRSYVVQPLPVIDFAADLNNDNTTTLSWKPQTDSLETSATAKKYIIYRRLADNGFTEIGETSNTSYTTSIEPGIITSYRVVAVNDGGKSFPSETLAVYKAKNEIGKVLILNGFYRVSAPDTYEDAGMAGFNDTKDHGVPYVSDISYIGPQYEYRREIPWMDDDAAGFGASQSTYETMVIAGNTFDYPYLHGKSIASANYSFASASVDALAKGSISADKYNAIDLILGKQKEVKMGSGKMPAEFKLYSKELQSKIKQYTDNGGNVFASGSYIGTDIWDKAQSDKKDIQFATEVLKYKWRSPQAAISGKVKIVSTPYTEFEKKNYIFANALNPEIYTVESPCGIEPSDNSGAYTFMRYSENNLSAGVAYKGAYSIVTMGFPFETIAEESQRNTLMRNILDFLKK